MNGPAALASLAAALLLAGWWLLRRGGGPRRVPPLLVLAALSAGMGTGLLAQIVASFTNPAGETLPIAISPITTADGIAGFEPADFTNATAVTLPITELVPPTFEECFPGGSVSMLLPAGPPSPSPYPACDVGLALNPADTCRVDVETLCRDLAAVSAATLGVTTPAPLILTVNGPSGAMTITNTSATVTALSVVSDLTGTALDGAVTETGNTCASVAPGASCSLTFTPGGSVVPETQFPIAGSNTMSVDGAIEIRSGSTLTAVNPSSGPASGGSGVTLTGTGLTGATGVTFGGAPATNVNVVNATTVTAVTPAHVPGAVDVVIATPAGGATLANGFTYVATAVGQPSNGGVIACLDGGLQNLVASTADNVTAIGWGGLGVAVGAVSTADGAANTTSIVAALGNNGGTPYAASLCDSYEVDSQGNVPCQAGNACYDDWFLPAQNQLNCLFTNRAAIGGFVNTDYWSSTESGGSASTQALAQAFLSGVQGSQTKSNLLRARCVRSFVP